MPLSNQLYYAEAGSQQPGRPPLVLIHGAAGDYSNWPVEARRQPGWWVLAPDLPGHGHSGGQLRQSVVAFAADLMAWLDSLGLYRTVLVGHGLGAAIALQIAVERPDMAAGLGLVGGAAHFELPPQMVEYFRNPLTIPLGIQLFQCSAFSPQTSPTLVQECLQPLRDIRPAVLAGDWQACADFDLAEKLEQVRAPCWVACGADDRLAPLPAAHFLASRLPTVRVQVIPSAGHMLLLEQPRAVVAGLESFLAGLFAVEPRRSRTDRHSGRKAHFR